MISGRQHFLPVPAHGKSKSLMFTKNPCKAGLKTNNKQQKAISKKKSIDHSPWFMDFSGAYIS
jgi:hypothetical protein